MREGWEIRKLGEICTSDLGKTLNHAKDTGELMPYLCSINVQWDKIDLSTVKQARFERADWKRFSVRQGDLLVCEGGDIGRAAIWENDAPMLYQNALHRVRFAGSIVPRYCLRYLQHLKQAGILDQTYGKGVTIKHLVKSSLFSIPIPVPPIPDQEKIVAELDCLREVIEKKKQQLEELDKLAQSIFYDMFGDPIANEKGWEMKRLKDVAVIVGGSTPKTNVEEYWNGENPWVTPAELHQNHYISSTERGISNEAAKGLTLLPIGTVLLSSRAPIGKVSITTIPMYCNQGFKNVICSQALNNEYMYHLLLNKTEYLNSLGTGATFKEISKKTTENIKIAIPPIELQEAFAEQSKSLEQQKALIKQSITETETLFNSRMDYWFNN